MKRHYSFCFLVVSLPYVIACNHTSESKPFPQEYILTSERTSMGGAFSNVMELKDDFLLCCSNAYIFVFSALDYSFVSKYKIDPIIRTSQIIRSSSPYLYFMDVNNKNEIRKYVIDTLGHIGLLQTGYAGMNSAVNLPYILHDSLLLYDEFIPEAAIKIRNLYTNAVTRTLPYGRTSLDDRFFDLNMGGLYANDSCMAFAYKYQDKIDFYDWQFNLIRSVNHQQYAPVIYREKGNYLNNVHYYGYSYMGRNYFYTLYRGVSNKIFRSDSLHVYREMFEYGIARDVLEVYDLNGYPVCLFRFDDVAPSRFVIDEEQNVLLGFRRSFVDSLLVYRLHGLPKNGKKYPERIQTIHSFFPDLPPPDAPKEFVQYTRVGGEIEDYPCYYIYNAYLVNGLFSTPVAREVFTTVIK